MQATLYPHIYLWPNGTPVISGTRLKVVHIAFARLELGRDAEQIQADHPTLTLGQIYSAFAYIYDHQQEMLDEIEAGKKISAEADEQNNPQLVAKIKAAMGEVGD